MLHIALVRHTDNAQYLSLSRIDGSHGYAETRTALKRLILIASTMFAMQTHAMTLQDPHLWLEDWTSPEVMLWVKNENRRTQAFLEGDRRYDEYLRETRKIAMAEDRIPYPSMIDHRVYNLWRDVSHPQGIWRYTSESDYASPTPHWTTILDLDALSVLDNKKWVFEEANCLHQNPTRCLLALSDGGEDAVTVREFDLLTGDFVKNGFILPAAKQHVEWLDQDTLLIARDWGEGTLTTSGYPFVVKALKRGQNLAQASEIFRGQASDEVSSMASVLEDAQGNKAVFFYRGVTFFENETYLLTAKGSRRLSIPAKAFVSGMIDGNVIILTNEEWRTKKAAIPAGAVVTASLSALERGDEWTPRLIFAPQPRQSVADIATSRSRLMIAINDNVKTQLQIFSPKDWRSVRLPLPDHASINIVAHDEQSERVYVSSAGFLEPDTLWSIDLTDPLTLKPIKALPVRFQAPNHIVEQFEAVSTDGTKIPYFIVHRQDIEPDGQTPTLMTAYGGFNVSMTPHYDETLGKLWLEQGGSFVLANIRGGGEFGPVWHEAGRKTKRQIVYDDFAAVAQDLFARKLTGPGKLGIYGGSNGGLLMGVAFNQHPDLWKAVIIQVPLLDMLRYESIAAGASWVDEYGSVLVPEEKAFLETISPYANISKNAVYPEPFIWTTTQDDRVGPQHARKFAARLKEYGVPYLFYEETEGGHSGDADIEQIARLRALEMTYFSRKLMDTRP